MGDYIAPKYIESTASIENLVAAIKNTLQYWLDIHTNPVAWAQNWNIEDDWHYLLENMPIIKNNYFEFDLRTAVVKEFSKDYALRQTNVYKCVHCGSYWDSGFEGCDCQGQEYNEDDYELVTEDNIDEFIEWNLEIYPEGERIDNDGLITEDMIEDAMINEGFPIYQNALSSLISGIVEDVELALKRYDECETNEDRLYWSLSVSSVLHVNGSILDDYGNYTGLDYGTVCQYRDNGINSIFTDEQIKEYIEG